VSNSAVLPPWLVLDPLLRSWLLEDIGRGDRTTNSLLVQDVTPGSAKWIAKSSGIIAGLPLAARVFQILNDKVSFLAVTPEGAWCEPGQIVAEIHGSLDALLMGERVALNLAMRLSGIATLTYIYVDDVVINDDSCN
jgi:nicotinate-nucleotide pyrophosphorylase (carboxylating)